MQLPVSGLEVRFRAPDGNDDLAILEAAGGAVERALAVLSRLARVDEQTGGVLPFGDDGDSFWRALTITDFETACLGLRRFLFGDTVSCMFRDNSHGCDERMELQFSIAAFLEEAKPGAPRGAQRSEEDPQWFSLAGGAENIVRFRLPSVEDQLQVMGKPQASSMLARRCIDAGKSGARAVTRAERAMEALAPLVSRPLEGICPGCGEQVTASLNVPRLLMDELQISAAPVLDEIHLIAATYHWDEATILAMPQRRRAAYAETIRLRERVAV
jgi:hypothetical protein